MLQSCARDDLARTARFMIQEHHLSLRVVFHMVRGVQRIRMNEDVMAKVEHADGHRRVVETPIEARQAEPGPSILALLTVSTIAAIFVLAIIWFVFFRT